jgi:hypothetical protein
MSDVDDRQADIDEDACLALTGEAEQCGNGTDTDASDPDEGLCGVHAGSDRPKVTDFGGPAWVGLRDDLTDLVRSERDAYALATISPDVDELWTVLTSLEDTQIGEVEYSARKLCYLAREVSQNPDLDAENHPLAYPNCIALQGRSAKNYSCPNSAYGASLLCGMHQDAAIPGTLLDDGEPGPDLDTVSVAGDEYRLVEQRGDDLIVVDENEYELRRLDDATGAETRWSDEETTPDLPNQSETLVLVGCGDAKADDPRAAKDLYTSNYFSLKRRYAQEYGDEWAILSAKYGLLDPEAEIEPYDVTVDDVDVGEWGVVVASDLPDVRDTNVVVLAGPDYAEEVEGTLFLYGADVERPTEGMKIGERMSWLSDQLDEDVDDQEAVEGDDDRDEREPLVRPQPAGSLPKYLVEGVEKQSPDRLRRLAEYAEQMADYKEEKAARELEERADQDVDTTPDDWNEDEWEDVVVDAREEADLASGKGTLTTKTIDDRDYYYLQWREGDNIKSQYVAPVTPADSEGSA